VIIRTEGYKTVAKECIYEVRCYSRGVTLSVSRLMREIAQNMLGGKNGRFFFLLAKSGRKKGVSWGILVLFGYKKGGYMF